MTFNLDQAIDLAVVGMRRIAVVGASTNPFRTSHTTIEMLLERGFEVVPVNPLVDEVLGLKCYPDLASVPGRIDVVDVFRREEHLPGVARDAVARADVAVVWNQLGLVSAEAREIVLGAGRVYIEDACLEVTIGRRNLRPKPAARLEASTMLLDLDDTILDHDACERSAVEASLGAAGLPADEHAIDTYVAINAAAWREYERDEISASTLRRERWVRTLTALQERPGGAVFADVDVDALSSDYVERFADSAVLLPGAVEAVWWLARRANVAVATNGFAEVQAKRLAAAGLDRLVHAFASSEEVGAAKPDPAVLRLALQRLGLDPDATGRDVAVVGDKIATDIAAGNAIGASTVWIAPAGSSPDPSGPQPRFRASSLADIA